MKKINKKYVIHLYKQNQWCKLKFVPFKHTK